MPYHGYGQFATNVGGGANGFDGTGGYGGTNGFGGVPGFPSQQSQPLSNQQHGAFGSGFN